MHSLFLSTNHHSFHCQNFSFHLHTLSLSTGRRLHTLAPLRIRIPKLSSFGCFSAPLYSWHTDFDAHIIARNNVSFTTIRIPKPSPFDRVYTDCDAHIIARNNVSFTTIRIPKPSPFDRVYTDCDAHIIARNNVSFTTIRIPKPSPFDRVYTDCDAHIIARNNVSFTTIPFRSSRNNIPLTDNDYPKAVDDNCACFVVATKNAAAAPLNAGEAIRRGASNLPGYRSSDVFFSEFPLWSLPSPSPPSM